MTTKLAIAQGTPEWLALRRTLVTATDIPVLLGVSPYKSEGDLAREKSGESEPVESTIPMRVGTALQQLIADEAERVTGRTYRQVHGLWTHPDLPWAAASPDGTAVGERRLLECKWTSSRSRFADGLPDDVTAQVAWQLFVSGYPAADVAVLIGGTEVRVFDVARDVALEDDLVAIAEDFRARLTAGGPFAESLDSIKRLYPSDDSTEMVADAELSEAVLALSAMRGQRKDMEVAEERIETAIKSRMGEATSLVGDGFRVTWKQTKPVEQIDWKSVADGALRQLPETEARALVGIATTVRQGFRPFRVTFTKEE